MKHVDIYTDGSCVGNPGPGGWAAIIQFDGMPDVRLRGRHADTTNNRMELTAAIMALRSIMVPMDVTLVTDSRYLCDGMNNGWARSWRKNGWRKKDGKPALNRDLWEELLDQDDFHKVTYVWIKGHAGHPRNEECDQIAQNEASRIREALEHEHDGFE